jgi:ABC-2 type transport system permease protein
MIADIGTVMWKEWKELVSSRSSRGKLIIVLFVALLGIYLPLQMGNSYVESPGLLLVWTWVALFMVSSVIADSFAGERERHTLETLLASRLSDRAILLGKVGAAIAYGVGITWLSLLVGLITVNLAHGQGHLLIFPAAIGLGTAGLSLLGAGLSAGAGILISLRASTARQAQTTLSILIMLVFFAVVLVLEALPASLLNTLVTLGTGPLIVIMGLILLVLDAALLVVAMARFRRARLILQE